MSSQPLVTVVVGQGEGCPPHRWQIARVEADAAPVERWTCDGCGEVRERALRRFRATPKRVLAVDEDNLARIYAGYEPHEAPVPLSN